MGMRPLVNTVHCPKGDLEDQVFTHVSASLPGPCSALCGFANGLNVRESRFWGVQMSRVHQGNHMIGLKGHMFSRKMENSSCATPGQWEGNRVSHEKRGLLALASNGDRSYNVSSWLSLGEDGTGDHQSVAPLRSTPRESVLAASLLIHGGKRPGLRLV